MLKTVIANNCFGGCISNDNALEFRSPTVNLQILPEEYPKFCANLKHYMDSELVEYTDLSEKHKEYCMKMFGWIPDNFPFGLLDDIIVCFQHYETFAEAKDCWERRKARMDYDSICYLFHAKNEGYKDAVAEFLALNLPHSAVITEDWGMEGTHPFDVPEGMDCFGSVNGKRLIEQNFSIKKFLEGIEQ